jgi:four helix bundle protein
VYPKHFIAKLTDSDAENAETQVWLEFAAECKYIDHKTFNDLRQKSEEIGKLIGFMIKNPKNFGA